LYEISERICRGVDNDSTKPFGGLHVILAGDLYQIRCVAGCPIVCPLDKILPANFKAVRGRQIYEKITNYFELIKNYRAIDTNGNVNQLASFNKLARLGEPIPAQLMATINERVVNNEEVAMTQAHPKALWITETHKKINRINKNFLEYFNREKKQQTRRLVATHTPSKVHISIPDRHTRDQLYGVSGDNKGKKYAPLLTHIDVTNGTRVRVIRNLNVQLGLWNGAMGTIVGFVYSGRGPTSDDQFLPKTPFCNLEDNERELPIVLVQMDSLNPLYKSAIDGHDNIVPFAPYEDGVTYMLFCLHMQGLHIVFKDLQLNMEL
jgi:hypothetical protein